MNVLIVGKDPRNTGGLVDYLNLLDGITASGITTDIDEFVRISSNTDTDLVILDIETINRGITGILHKLEKIEAIPRILVLTVHPETELAQHQFYHKKVRFLSKDLGIDSVLELIRKYGDE